MAIKSPFKHFVPLSSAGQPNKPVLPIAVENVYASSSDIAATVGAVTPAYEAENIDRSKAKVLSSIASAVASLSTSADAESAAKSSLVSSINPSSVVEDQIDYIFSDVAPHPGYGSSSVRAELTVIKQRSTSVPVACGVNGVNSTSIPVSASITLFDSPSEVIADCSGTVASAFYQIVEYRWRLNDAADRPWSRSNASNFGIVGDQSYELAVRIRISANAVLIGNDWGLQYSLSDPVLNDWTSIGDANISIDPQVWNPDIGYDGEGALKPASFITNPGPGKFTTLPGFYASVDDQSLRIALSTPNIIETEIRYQLYIASSLTSETVWFRLAIIPAPGINDHIYISSYHPRLAEPWIDEVG